MKVEVIRSARRRKTVQARLVDGVVRVHIPASMSVAEEEHWVGEMVKRVERRRAGESIDLEQRARMLARQLGLEHPASIRWVENQEMRWGSCTPVDSTIRISSRLAKEPAWVVDYVIVHELAHLSVAGHGPRFWDLVNRYRLAERARGFLMARGMEADPEEAPPVSPTPGISGGEPGMAPGPAGEMVAAAGLEGSRPSAGSYRPVAPRYR